MLIVSHAVALPAPGDYRPDATPTAVSAADAPCPSSELTASTPTRCHAPATHPMAMTLQPTAAMLPPPNTPPDTQADKSKHWGDVPLFALRTVLLHTVVKTAPDTVASIGA